MKRKLLLLSVLCLFFAGSTAKAEFSDDFWDEPMKIDTEAKNQQKSVTDKDFEKVMSFFEKNKKKKEQKKKPKGNPVWENNAPEEQQQGISNILKDLKDDYPTVMIPVTLITKEKTEIPPGFYRILSAKNEEGYFINFYQGNSLVAKVKAENTGNDFNQKSLNYAKVIPNGETLMNVIYGDIDCNLEATLDIMQ